MGACADLLSQLALLRDERLKFRQLLLRQLLGLVGVMAHEEQLLVVALLGRQRELTRLELVGEADALLLETCGRK